MRAALPPGLIWIGALRKPLKKSMLYPRRQRWSPAAPGGPRGAQVQPLSPIAAWGCWHS